MLRLAVLFLLSCALIARFPETVHAQGAHAVHVRISGPTMLAPMPRGVAFPPAIPISARPMSTAAYDSTLFPRLEAALRTTFAHTWPFEQHWVAASVIVHGPQGLMQWNGAVGTSDSTGALTGSSPMSPDLLFEMGSCTKTFTSALILSLEDSGKLSISDPIGKYLPRLYMNIDPNITVKQLLEHSSGLFDYVNDDSTYALLNDAYGMNPTHHWTADEILQSYVGPRHFSAGATYQYSNTNYLVLGLVADSAARRPAADEMHSRFFAPLGLTHTLCGWADSIPPPERFPHNWTASPDSLTPSNDYSSIDKTAPLSVANTAGGMISTPAELARWAQKLYTGQLLSPTAMRELTTFHTWSNGLVYGLGVMKVPYYSRMLYGHAGSIPGFQTMVFTNPIDSTTVALYLNSDMDPGDVQPNDYLVALLNEIYTMPKVVRPGSSITPPADAVRLVMDPGTGHSELLLTLAHGGLYTLTVRDLLGRTVAMPRTRELVAGSATWSLDAPHLPAGSYLWTLTGGEGGALAGRFLAE